MLRLTEVRLGLDHDESEIKASVLRVLGISELELKGFRVRRRGHDARRNGQILFIYTIDAEVQDEAGLLRRLQ